MRKRAVRTVLALSAVVQCDVFRCSRAILITIHRAVAEKAVECIRVLCLVTWEIFAKLVLKKFIMFAHGITSCHLSCR